MNEGQNTVCEKEKKRTLYYNDRVQQESDDEGRGKILYLKKEKKKVNSRYSRSMMLGMQEEEHPTFIT